MKFELALLKEAAKKEKFFLQIFSNVYILELCFGNNKQKN